MKKAEDDGAKLEDRREGYNTLFVANTLSRSIDRSIVLFGC